MTASLNFEPQEVTLTTPEQTEAAVCGALRNITAIRDKRPDANGCQDKAGWNSHIEGACGELAVAKLLGRFWSPSVNTFHAADIEPDIQVRTRSDHKHELIVRVNDNPEHRYVLVTGRTPKFLVHGYCLGKDARRDEWFQGYGERPKAWFVPQDELLPWQDLLA